MPPQPPELLIDNLFDTIQLYPNAVLSSSSELPGREARRVADYRRERTWWQAASEGDRVHIDATMSPAGGTGRLLTGVSGLSTSGSTSWTIAFLMKSTATLAGAAQVLLDHSNAGAVYRTNSGNLAVWDAGAGALRSFGPAPTDDAWHTIVFTFNQGANAAKCFVDGVQSGPTRAWATGAMPSGTWSFLARRTAVEATPAKLARVAMWNVEQSPANVATIHTLLMAGGAADGTFAHDWSAGLTHGTQLFSDGVAGVNAYLGTTGSLEFSPERDPMWGGGAIIDVDLGGGNTASPNYLYFDRGHNLWDRYIIIEGSLDNVNWWLDRTLGGVLYIPPLGAGSAIPTGSAPDASMVGGVKTMAVTEEGACYAFFVNGQGGPMTASRFWRVRFWPNAGVPPIVTGLMLGTRTPSLGYSATFDEDAGERTMRTEVSDAGWMATGRVASWRTLDLDFRLIGASDYDATLRRIRGQIFERNQPFVALPDWGTTPARGWMYQSSGTRWSAPRTTIYRGHKMTCRELGPLFRA